MNTIASATAIRGRSKNNITSCYFCAAPKRIVYVELMALIFADGKFSKEEEKFVKQVQVSLEIKDDFCKEAHQWVQKIIPLYKDGFKLVGII
jgi:hypothetical protein